MSRKHGQTSARAILTGPRSRKGVKINIKKQLKDLVSTGDSHEFLRGVYDVVKGDRGAESSFNQGMVKRRQMGMDTFGWFEDIDRFFA